jgi:two-component system chemotaxis sensor kinase CheA
MSIELTPSHEYFIEESLEVLAETQRSLQRSDLTQLSFDLISQVFRAVHSIKGTAATLGIADITALTHHVENILEHVRCATASSHGLKEMYVRVLQLSLDEISTYFDIYRARRTPSQEQARNALNSLDILFDQLRQYEHEQPNSLDTVPTSAESKLHEHRYQVQISNGTQKNIQHITESLSALGELKIERSDVVTAQCYELLSTETSETIELVCALYMPRTQIKVRVLPDRKSTEHKSETGAYYPVQTGIDFDAQPTPSVRVSVGQLVDLNTLIDELSDLKNTISKDKSRLSHVWNMKLLDGNLEQLRNLLRRMRTKSFKHLFSKIEELTQNLSTRLEKDINLHITGAELITDKFIIEQINAPLIQLIRNSIDHGIELPQVRRQFNKCDSGNIFLCARYEHNRLLLEVADDGAGLDRDKVLAAALSNRITLPSHAPEQDIWKLIFAPGLTTARSVTAISGRGYGLDIVKQTVNNLGGEITVESTPGKGTKFAISIPMQYSHEIGRLKEQTEIHS